MSTLLVNFRHVFYALSFPLHRVAGRGWKTYSSFSLTDEAYALTANPDAQTWSRTRILTIQATFHAAWVTFVAVGAGLGTMIPPSIVGLDFAVTALFLVLGIEAYKVRRGISIPALALGCALVAGLISKENMLLIAMSLFIAVLIGSYVAKRRNRD